MICFKNRELKRLFLESYLVSSGFPAEASDVDALFLDASFHSLGYHWGPMAPRRFSDDGDLTVAAYKVAIESIRNNTAPFLETGEPFLKYTGNLPEVKMVRAA